jgi:MSHA biogenesis protein MshM
MYASHFGLNELPFSITPDTSYFFAHPCYQDALNTLLLAVHSGEGFIKVTGEVGTGKTLLCRKLLGALGEGVLTAYVPNPYLEPRALLLAVADELGVGYPEGVEQHQLLRLLSEALLAAARAGKQVVICLDEAQAMSVDSLEALRLLSNLETERRKLLQVVLFGQPELDDRLDQPSIRQLRQRIAFSCRLVPLSLAETTAYVAHRLKVAGYRGAALFSRGALRRLQRASAGIPRLVNILAHKALMSAYGEGGTRVLARHVALAAADTESARGLVRQRRRRLLQLSGALAAVLLATWGALYWSTVS